MGNLVKKCENLPVGAIATAVGLATLSNVYFANGFVSVRFVTMILVMFVWVGAIIKLTSFTKVFLKEYENVVPASLYGTFTMLTMILGSFVFDYVEWFGRVIWLIGLGLHTIHLLVFLYRNVIKGVKRDTFVPSWFVTLAGILVSVVVGVPMGMPGVLTVLMYYAFGMYIIAFPIMIYRINKHPIPPQFAMTRVILLAPTSLVFVTYLNVANTINQAIVFALYGILFATIVYVSWKLPVFLGKPFNPAGHPALTFPTAIALVATFRMVGFLAGNGNDSLAEWLGHFFGIQLWVTTAIMAYVGYNFVKIFTNSVKKQENC